MKTAVFQSYRTVDVPHWIVRCLESVRQWAGRLALEYRFYDDAIFEQVPSWYREAVKERMLPMSDLARLITAQALLETNDRVIWIDADVLVFDPYSLHIEGSAGFAVCSEVWVRKQWGAPVGERRVNNAVMLFDRGNPFLEFFIHATKERVRQNVGSLSDWVGGPEFLTPLNRIMPLPRIEGVGLFSPLVMHGIANDDARWVERYAVDFGCRVQAANLCGSAAGKQIDDILMTDDLYHAVIDALIESRGEVVNRYMPARRATGN